MIDPKTIATEITARIDAQGLTDLAGVRQKFRRFLYLPDPVVVDVTLATYVAHRIRGDPVWLLIVGASGRGKTEAIASLTAMEDVHALSALTAQTFASGMKGKRQASLLYRLQDDGKKFLTLKDFTTVLSMHRDARAEVFAQLREIYDGAYRKEFGTGETVEWEGRLGFLAGVTPAIDQHHAALALLGERFLCLRLPDVPRQNISRRALETIGTEADERRELRRTVRTFLQAVEIIERPLTTTAKDALSAVANIVTWARSAVPRDGYSREIVAVPEPEAPTRFAKQLAGLLRALEVLGHDEDSALSVCRRVGADAVPPPRLALMRLLISADDWSDTTAMAEAVNLPTTTARRALEDLVSLRLAERRSQGAGRADQWRVGDETLALWWEASL